MSLADFPNSASPTFVVEYVLLDWGFANCSVAVHTSSSISYSSGRASALGSTEKNWNDALNRKLLSTANTSKKTNHQNTQRGRDEEKQNPLIVLALRRSNLRDLLLLFFFDTSTTALDGCSSSSIVISIPSASC
jgi:hypothetical protein